MKRLILARHAKSSWSNPGLRDIERPLNKRGKRAAPIMGGVLRDRRVVPEAIFASPSVRTRMTSALLAEQVGFPVEQIEIVEAFYGANPAGVVRFAWSLDDDLSTVMLVGHNPTWTSLCDLLTGEFLDNLPTSGILVIDFKVEHWSEISGQGKIHSLLLPRDFGCGGGQ